MSNPEQFRAGVKASRDAISRAASEAGLQEAVTDLLELLGWRWHHETDSRRTHAGWPDLFACHPVTGWWAALELKATTGQTTTAQLDWLSALASLSVEPAGLRTQLPRGWVWQHATQRKLVGLIYPADLDELVQLLGELSR